jgi:AcrR family transcriptional regulator
MTHNARRQRIIDEALRALDRQDYEQIQMRDIAAGTGMALRTLYQNFSSKEHLYATVLLEWAAKGRSQAGRLGGASAPERVRNRIHGVITAYEREPQFFRVQATLHSTSDENARAVLAEFSAIATAVLADDLGHGPTGLAADCAVDAATMLWSLVCSILVDAVYGDARAAEVHRLVDRLIDILFATRPAP